MLLQAPEATRRLLVRAGNDFTWSGWRNAPRLLCATPWHAQLRELGGDVGPVVRRTHFLVDKENPSIESNVEGPPRREGLILVDDPVGRSDRTGRIAEERIVHPQRLRKRFVGLGRVDADREMRNVELSNGV